jgi:uncharacterized protein YprB with RNaseH-like and TPR domain
MFILVSHVYAGSAFRIPFLPLKYLIENLRAHAMRKRRALDGNTFYQTNLSNITGVAS